MELKALLQNISPQKVVGARALEITGLALDSRRVTSGGLFAALPGTQVDGHQFIGQAIEKGAVAVLLEKDPPEAAAGVTYIQVGNSAAALARIADVFYGQPSRKLQLVGITGTNGKTTTATLLYETFSNLGYKTGLLSTIVNRIGRQDVPATHTTPDMIQVQALLRDMVDAGCDYAFMEVSSHALVQHRADGLYFAGGVFTNISHDHLDYHGSFANYIQAKKRLFDLLPGTAFALVNADDRRSGIMVQNTKAKVYRFALQNLADFRARVLESSLLGLQLELDGQVVFSRLIGHFNAYNLLTAYSVGRLLDQDAAALMTVLSGLRAAEGRFDCVVKPGDRTVGIVDYAHTPDALEQVLATIGDLREARQKVITVVGCGGDRDKRKRPLMARAAVTGSDQVILTSDNPRTEDPLTIIEDMKAGLSPEQARITLTIPDRREAIRAACRMADGGHILLVAGKGHEKYQEINGQRLPFDDKEILKAEFFHLT